MFAISSFFFSTDAASTEIYTLSLHDALPICCQGREERRNGFQGDEPDLPEGGRAAGRAEGAGAAPARAARSEEHTSELQSPCNLVCRLLLEKKKKNRTKTTQIMK